MVVPAPPLFLNCQTQSLIRLRAPLSGQFFLLFYSNLQPSKHETALWSTFSPSDILGKRRAKLFNSLKNFEVIGGGGGGGGVITFLF